MIFLICLLQIACIVQIQEYPGYEAHSGTPNDRENFRLLLDEVRSALDTLGGQNGRFYGLTAALPCGPSHIANLDIAHVARTLSELNLMTYDFNGAFSPVTGMNSPLYPQGWGEEGFSVHECVQNWLAGGGTKDKINVGLVSHLQTLTTRMFSAIICLTAVLSSLSTEDHSLGQQN